MPVVRGLARLADKNPRSGRLRLAGRTRWRGRSSSVGPDDQDRLGVGHELVGGDSAGGGLVVAALLLLRDEGRALPTGVPCVCPFADLSLSSESWTSPATPDLLIQ